MAIDLPGFKKTSLPDVARIGSYAELLSEAILGIPELKRKKFVLVGHSLGGAAASALLAHEEIVRKLRGVVLIAPAGFGLNAPFSQKNIFGNFSIK